jgi:alpha-glucosidase (family GH31 glycosyl hydrolase)
MRLTPYIYTYCNEAYETGVPAVRAMVLEYPDNPVCWGTDTRYQFMSGENFLIAPVYKYGTNRDSIYFPEGEWIDYWNGDRYFGSSWINDYPISLNKIPVFVKAGSIIPMYPEMLYDGEIPKDPITFDIYPFMGYSNFELYEDDGLSREHREGAYSKTLIECNAGWAMEPIVITVGESIGEFEGKLEYRSNLFEVHWGELPWGVSLDDEPLVQ